MPKPALSLFQILLLQTYKLLQGTGILQTQFGYRLFHISYNFYKALFEARSIKLLKDYALPGSTVIDVGANIGFFTRRFSKWVGQTGQVIAIEPETSNFKYLQKNMSKANTASNIIYLNAAACDKNGMAKLVINPNHPGDHKLGDSGQSVSAIQLDSLLANNLKSQVSLVKIDVQGAEFQVIQGSIELVKSFRPTLFIEVDDGALQNMNSSAELLLHLLKDLRYDIHYIHRNKVIGPITLSNAIQRAHSISYSDFIFIPIST